VPVVTPVTVQNGTCVPSSNVTCTTSTPVTTGVAPGTCVVGDAASSPWENVTSCSTVTTGPTIIASCTASGPTSANSYVTTTCVNPASDTGFVNASSCTAGFVSGSGNVTCRTTDTGFVDVLSCTASSANGQTITCNNSVAGSKIQWQADTTVSTQKTSGGVSVGSPTVVTTLAGTTWNNLDNNCYAAAALPTLPTDGSPTPSLPPAPDPGCTAWPCTVTNTVDAGGSTGSLADVAEYYYRTDLRPTMTDNVQAAGSGPEEDTASWQHMTTFTMGLGLSGTLAYQDDYKTATTGDFALLRNGTKIWPVPTANNPTALDDLWHAAANGRGQFFSAADPDSVVNGLVTALSGAGPFTVFAPTDSAFAKLPAGTVPALLEDKAKLTSILTYHVVAGRISAADLKARADKDGYVTLKTLQGGDLRIHLAGSKVHVGEKFANVTAADVAASNGVIHVIDAVLLPGK